MAGNSGSVLTLAEHLVRVDVGHVVSSPSMVSRAFLVDSCVGVVVDAGDRGYWLVSALSALAPDPDGLRVRAAEKGGIPVEHGVPRLVKLTLGWGDSTVDLSNPSVVAGDGVGVVSLAIPASLGEKIRAGDGPRPVDLSHGCVLGLGDSVGVVVPSGRGPLIRWARVCSDPNFDALVGAVGLDTGLAAGCAGSPVFAFGEPAPSFCGLAAPVDDATSVLIPAASLAQAIPAVS